MRDLGLSHNLGCTEGTIARQFRWGEMHSAAASAALNFEGTRRNRCQLLRSKLEIFFVGTLLHFGSTGGNRLATAAVGAGEAAVTRFKNEVCRAPWTLIAMNLLRR